MLSVATLALTAAGGARTPAVAVVTTAGVEAYAQTLEGIRDQLPDVQIWDARDEAHLRENLNKQVVTLAVAVGSDASAVLRRLAPAQVVLVNSVALEWEVEHGGTPELYKATVTIDLPPGVLINELKRLFPGKRRIGMIRGPMQTAASVRAFEQAARQSGFTVEVLTCGDPRDLLERFLQFKSRADLVWCPPNPNLYTTATLKPLLVASLTNRLPIIGFSEQFVRAGALFGGSADFVEVGRQTAELALRIARNEPVPAHQDARKFRFAYNERVARLLGVKATGLDGPADRLLVIR